MLERHHTVANVVIDHSECAEVFQRHRIDFCCRGELSLEAAAQARQLDVDTLVAELTQAIAARQGGPTPEVRELTTPQLVAHILLNHHEALRRALPFARTLAVKVNRVHGAHNPKLYDLMVAVEELEDTLLPHLEEEERTVFPLLSAQPTDHAAAAKGLESMADEHQQVATLFERIRAATEQFTLPDWACMSYRTLFAELEKLEALTFKRVHLENHVLKPRFVAA